MDLISFLSIVALLAGAFFFLVGTVGLLRFPDVYSRLHAITKADSLGFGLTALGLALQAESWRGVGILLLIWGLVLLASTTCCHLVAQAAVRAGIRPWSRS